MSDGNTLPMVRLARLLGALVLLLGAASCAHRQDSPAGATPAGSSATEQSPSATASPSPKDRLDLAVDLLQKGEADRARAELRAYLDDVPDSKPARMLLSEIETPLSDLYPKQNFLVTLGTNDTLSGLAAVYLGDPLAFYGLARYNDITEPAKIIAGQQIRIPATPVALAAHSNRLRRGTTTANSDQPTANASTPISPPPAPVVTARKSSGDQWTLFKAALSRKQYSEAARLADAAHFDSRGGRAAILADTYMDAALAERQTDVAAAVTHARTAGRIYLGTLKLPEKARASFQLVISLSPSDGPATAGLKQANDEVAEKYYRRGLLAFQHQDLDGAIAAWNIVLSIDTNYRDVQLNRAQAIQLKANLQKLKG